MHSSQQCSFGNNELLHYRKFATRHLLYAQICRLALWFAATRFNCVVSHQQVTKKRRKRKFTVEHPHSQDWCTNSHLIFITQILGAVCETHQSRLSVVQPFQDQQHKLVSSLITLSTKIGSSTAFLFLTLSLSQWAPWQSRCTTWQHFDAPCQHEKTSYLAR